MTLTRLLPVLIFGMVVACRPMRPDPIAYGTDACEYCRMMISDPRFGGEIITRKGRTIKFDGVDCLLSYYKGANAAADVASVWVLDARHAGEFIDAKTAWFIDLGDGKAAMGRGWAAIVNRSDASLFGISPDSARQWASLQ
jgi:copper chaperone NosL